MRDAPERAQGRKRGGPSRRPTGHRPVILRILGGFTARPGTTTLGLVGVGLLGAIVVNALVMQDKKHPAPLFNEFAAAPALRSAGKPELAMAVRAAPVPEPRPVAQAPAGADTARKPDQIGALLQGGAPAASQPVSSTDKTAAITRRDSIGQLLKTGTPAAEPASFAEAPVDRSVLNAQKALARLGYGIKADGKAGPGTRQAIEKFERTRRLPVTGELNPRTTRELAALSGLPLD